MKDKEDINHEKRIKLIEQMRDIINKLDEEELMERFGSEWKELFEKGHDYCNEVVKVMLIGEAKEKDLII